MTNALEAVQTNDESGRGPLAGLPRGRTRQAIDLMVFQGLPRDMAAAQCGLKPKSLTNAMALPSVKQYYAAQLQVLRDGERARNIHRLVAIRDAADNMPAVNAIKALEQIDDEARSTQAMQRAPGLQIVVVAAPQALPAQPPVIEHNAERTNT
jgi:hypothetical protein